MEPAANSYSLPETIEPDLARVLTYWKDLIRGENDMPFSDDIDLSHLPELADRTFLVLAFENPERFRFESAGTSIAQQHGETLNGTFSDEIEERPPLEAFTEQCRAAVARRAPTYYRSGSPGAGGRGYARVLLPTWGDGHVSLLLGAVAEIRDGTA